MTEHPNVGFFRPADERAERAIEILDSLGVRPVYDCMLEVVPLGTMPKGEADVLVFTSTTGVEILERRDWSPDGETIAAIGEHTAAALRDAGYGVDVVPEEYSSRGLVEALADRVDGESVEIVRSDHGSDVLLDGLEEAGADVVETVLYRLTRPEGSGQSAEYAASGAFDAVLFTSSLTVQHFVEAARERDLETGALEGLADAVVGAIGEPTAETLREHGVSVDVVPETAEFEALAEAAVAEIEE